MPRRVCSGKWRFEEKSAEPHSAGRKPRILPGVNLRDPLDLDSMDFLDFMVALHEEFGVDIPEAEYRKFLTLDGCVLYIEAAKGGQPC